jgi:hypothetical protein
VPCLEDTVERGVLARVVAELLLIDKSANQQCGVCSSSQFAAAYLGEDCNSTIVMLTLNLTIDHKYYLSNENLTFGACFS